MSKAYLEGGLFDGEIKEVQSGTLYVVMPEDSPKRSDGVLLGGFYGGLIAEASGHLYRKTDRKRGQMIVFAYDSHISGPLTREQILAGQPDLP